MKKPAYSAALDRVLFRASRLARELGGAQTGTEHLLLALSQERISQTGRILCYQGAEGRLLRCMLLTRQEPAKKIDRFLCRFNFRLRFFCLIRNEFTVFFYIRKTQLRKR